MENVEILVHISAPSGAKDDQRYRRQAEAFLEYERRKKHAGPSCSKSGRNKIVADALCEEGNKNGELGVLNDENVEGTTRGIGEDVGTTKSTPKIASSSASGDRDDSSPCPATSKPLSLAISSNANGKETVNSSLQSSKVPAFASKEDAASYEPRSLRGGIQRRQEAPLITPVAPSLASARSRRNKQTTFSSRVSRVSETPLKPPPIESSAPPSLIAYLRGRPPPEPQRPRTAPSVTTKGDPTHPRAPLRRSRSATDSFETPLSAIPDSQPSFHQESPLAEHFRIMEDPNDRRPYMNGDGERPNKRVRLDAPFFEGNGIHNSTSSANPISLLSSDEASTRTISSPHGHDDDAQRARTPSLPPPPSPSLHPLSSPPSGPHSSSPPPLPYGQPHDAFSSLQYASNAPAVLAGTGVSLAPMPEGFAILAAGAPLDTYFKPDQQTRELAPLERGHWEVTVPLSLTPINHHDGTATPWTAQEFVSFYAFIHDFISSGRAGWNVWATRDGEFHSIDGALSDFDGRGREVVRFFCPGGLVGHAWLALLAGSHRRIRRLEAVWRDAAGEVVVRMEPWGGL